MDIARPKLTNVEEAFGRLPKKGPRIERIAGRVLAEGVYSHIQGVAVKDDHYLFTHADQCRESGRLLVARRDNLALAGWTEVLPFIADLEQPFYPHAGGCQGLGDLLVVPCETIGGPPRSVLAFIDVEKPEQPIELGHLRIPRSHKAMAAGLTMYRNKDGDVYLVAAYEHGRVDFYWSDALSGQWSKTLEPLRVSEQGHQAFLLFTESTESVFAIGLNHIFRTWKAELGWANWAVLYRLHFADGCPHRLERLTKKTFGTHDGAALRWGASIEAVSDAKLVLYCTEKRFDDRHCVLNVFDPDTPPALRATGPGVVTFVEASNRSQRTRPRARPSRSKKSSSERARKARSGQRPTGRGQQR